MIFNVAFIAASFAWVRWGYSPDGIDIVDEIETAGGDASVGEAATAILSALQTRRAENTVRGTCCCSASKVVKTADELVALIQSGDSSARTGSHSATVERTPELQTIN